MVRTAVFNGELYVHEDDVCARGTIGPYDAGSPMGERLSAALEGLARVHRRAYGVEVGDGWIVYALPAGEQALSIRLELHATACP